MSDKELLELAAKAAGIEVLGVSFEMDGSFAGFPTGGQKVWNPLTDDGDALRLAVKLKIDVCSEYWNDDESVQAQNDNGDICVEQKGLDPYAATRRAIVRAAAEIESAYDRQSA